MTKEEILNNRKRRNAVRRLFKRAPLYAVEAMQKDYPGYNWNDLWIDLKKRSKPKLKGKKQKTRRDFRYCQIQKLHQLLTQHDAESKEYGDYAGRLASLIEADQQRLPIKLICKYQGTSVAYQFPWYSAESEIKEHAEAMNRCKSFLEYERWSEEHFKKAHMR